MAYVQAQKNLLSGDLKQLIVSATGFDENSEELASFEKHVWSSIMQREFPSVNKTSVKSDLFGFVEKFKTHFHYFPQKADNLQRLIHYCFQINSYKDDVLWNLLHLLLLLSKNPTSASEDDEAIQFPLCEAEPVPASFDWGAYLKEGLPDYRLPSEESSEEEEEFDRSSKEDLKQILAKLKQINSSGLNTSETSMNTIVPFLLTNTSYDTTLRNRQDPSLFRTGVDLSSETVTDKVSSREQLKAALITKDSYRRTHCYWWKNPSYRELYSSKMPLPNACLSWEQKIVEEGGRVTLGETRIISEYKAMKEIIFVLCHPQSCFVITKTEFGFKPAEKVSLCSTNPIDLYHSLSEICSHLSLIEEINKFIEDVTESCPGLKCINMPNTYVAYASALKHVMNQFINFLTVIDSYVSQKQKIYLVGDLLVEVRPWLKLIKHLHNVHMRAVPQNWRSIENWICASRLLAVLYESIETSFGWEKINLTLIFLRSLAPYLEILDTWLVHGKNSDTQEEFLIRRASRVMCEGNLVVEDYKSHLLDSKDCLFLDNFIYHSIKACSSIDFQIILQKDLFKMPEVKTHFFMEYLTLLINNLQEERVEPVCESDLKQKYESVEAGCHPRVDPDPTQSAFTPITPQNFGHCTIWDEFEPRLAPSCVSTDSDSIQTARLLSKLESMDVDSVNIARLLTSEFTSVISERMQPKGFARDTLLNQYNLLDHLNVLKSVYLCCDGVKISIFSKTLFSKVMSNGLRTLSWTNELRELLYKDHPAYYSNFIVCLASKKLGFRRFNQLNATYPDFIEYSHNISLTYLVAPPLNLVITSESLSKYNELFNFLLKIKWAMFCLSHLSFSDLKDENEGPLSARLVSLRMFLLHNISTFEKYFISINSEDFDTEIVHVCSVARDIHVIANALDKFLNQRRKHCFLVGSPRIYSCMISVLEFCQELKTLWDLSCRTELEGLLSEQLSSLELKYQESMNELADSLIQLTTDYFYKNNVNFNYLCDELFNNMPGDWE